MDATTGATMVAGVINSTGLNCRTNSSSSSTSSGYASGHSTASTPATPISTHYDTSTHTTQTTAVPPSEVPTATVAPVTPFYSDTTLGQQHRQQYYQSFSYSNAAAQYNPVYDAYTGNSYHNLTSASVERSLSSNSSSSYQRLEKQSKNHGSHSTSGGLSQHYATSVTTTTCATTKPQATATPFFAQPSTNMSTSAATYYDTYGKYKMPSAGKLTSQTAPDYASNYTNHLQHAAAAAATFSYQQQQQHYYAAAKSQLQDVNYAAAVVKPHRQHNVGNSSAYYGSSGAYYDKYIYGPTANPATYSNAVPSHTNSPHPYSPHEPTTADPYRKAAAAVAANAWHWNMEYAAATAGNCRNLPPTANGGGYLSTSNVSSNGRDSFCAVTGDKYGKCDKYSAYYAGHHHPQQYMTPSTHSTVVGSSTNSRNLWPNSPHHTPHIASVQAVINERLPHTLPPSASQHQYPHTHTHTHAHSNTHHLFGSTTSAPTQRQNCCSQPFQQQTCYYPRPTQQYPPVPAPNAYATTQPTHYSSGANSNTNHKYSAYSSSYKATNSNDLYLTSPFDTPPATYNYGNGSTTPMQQRYGAVGATSAAFYNDLNVQSAFESYANNTISQPTLLQPHNVTTHPTHHLSYQTHGTNQSSSATGALLDYRKPLSATATDCCMSSARVPLSNHDPNGVNTPNYLTYDVHGNPIASARTVITSPTIYSDGGSSSEKSTPTTKNLSLRDFLTTWNEEEEEDLNNATEQLSFINENVENVDNANYIVASGSEQGSIPLTTTPQPSQSQTQSVHQSHAADQQFPSYKHSYQQRPKIHVGITVDGPMDVEASQYFNLPDIIIDIEKSNTTGAAGVNTTAIESVESVASESSLHHHSPCGGHDMFESFDVEKELDELQIKRAKLCLEKQLNNEIRILTPEPVVPLSQEVVEHHNEIQQHQHSIAVHHVECEKSYDSPEHFLKDIELNDNNSHSSNSSTFEKEYETFINRIDLDKVSVEREQNMRKQPVIVTHQSTFVSEDAESVSRQSSDIKTPPDPILSEEMDESTQNLHFTMFYKKKRKLMKDFNESELIQPISKQLRGNEAVTTTAESDKISEDTTKSISNEDVQKALRKRCKKVKTKIAVKLKARRRPFSQFYKLLRRGNRKRNTSMLVQKHIAKLKERHLPLIKRKSFKNYSSCDNVIFNPRSLMHFAVSLVNTNEFQAQLLEEREKLLKEEVYSQQTEKGTEIDEKLPQENSIKRIEFNANYQQTMEPPDTEITTNSQSQNKDIIEVIRDTKDLTESLEEQGSSSNSVNGSASLKEQEDFIGFEGLQTTRISPPNVSMEPENVVPNNDVCALNLRSNLLPEVNANVMEGTVAVDDQASNENHCLDISDVKSSIMSSCCEPSVKISPEVNLILENSNTEKTNNIDGDEKSEIVEYNNDVDSLNATSGELERAENIEKPKNDVVADENRNNALEMLQSCENAVEFKLDSSQRSEKIRNENVSSPIYQRNDISEIGVNNDVVGHNPVHDFSNLEAKASLLSCTQSLVHAQNIPLMRTKASVKMCDFTDIKHRHSSTKCRSKSVSPTSGNSNKTRTKLELSNKKKVCAFVFDGVGKIDKTKFVEKWAASVSLTDIADVPMNATEANPCLQKVETPSLGALDLSPSSRSLQNPTPIFIEEDSSSSSTSTSSSSTSSNSKSDSKNSITSSSSSSSSENTTKSTTTTKSSNHCSTDASDFNELKALQRELSLHKTCADWARTETVQIGNYATDNQGLNIFNVKKTDTKMEENIKAEAQDIAYLKEILESEHDITAVSEFEKFPEVDRKEIVVSEKCKTLTSKDMEVCAAVLSSSKKPTTLENITEDLLTKKSLQSKDNDNLRKHQDTAPNIIYQNPLQKQPKRQQQHNVVIPKLSDLCKIALNSSFVKKNLNSYENETNVEKLVMSDKDEPIPPKSPAKVSLSLKTHSLSSQLTTDSTVQQGFDEDGERELTVEEALAEMYRQAGVMSDHEDNAEDSMLPSDNGENQAQDFLLINLAEILENSDSENNVFVLQCDMNENLLRVMATSPNANETSSNEVDEIAGNNDTIDNVSTLQLVQILNASDLELISESEANNEEYISDPALLPTYDGNGVSIVNINEDSYSACADLPIIHHEEIVPDNYKKFEKEQFLKYLHAKYVQRNVKKFHHTNRILRKYRRHFLVKRPLNSGKIAQHSHK